ncbi:MAG: methionine adenosyltransferase [Candidatus Ancillula sp.]|jgi:S-adenosylmethionine synthetase|nr:methionine adenosyltransferase [Candidatus Ancillula sp.]
MTNIVKNMILFEQTSEAVSIGHPDKVADSIADAVLDYLRTLLPDAHSAVEVACAADKLFIFGEVDSRLVYDKEEFYKSVEHIAWKRLDYIGYKRDEYSPKIVVDIVKQSSEIDNAVSENDIKKEIGAGDQGIMFGYAVVETPECHSLHFVLAHLLQVELEKARFGADSFLAKVLRPDAKTQVTVQYQYTEEGINQPAKITDVVLSTQHIEDVDFNELQGYLKHFCEDAINHYLEKNKFTFRVDDKTVFHINPAGPWNVGGPVSDSGLTGRKLVVDNYGGNAPIGGGSYSGKDLTKVDRSAAYFARYVAKSIVKSDLAEKVQVSLAYAIGEALPTMINIDTYGTEKIPNQELKELVLNNFDFSVKSLIELSSNVDNFVSTGEHSHYMSFSQDADDVFPWEKIFLISNCE